LLPPLERSLIVNPSCRTAAVVGGSVAVMRAAARHTRVEITAVVGLCAISVGARPSLNVRTY
jgi:hypothetical protein